MHRIFTVFGWMTAMLGAVELSAAVLPIAPSVTAAEVLLLEQAAAVAVTNPVAAVEMLESSGRDKQGPAVDFAVGNFHFQMEAYDAAVAAYANAVRKLPSFRDARKNTGRAWLLLGREAEAVRVYQELISDGHIDADIFLLLGHGLMMRGHAVPAESAYRQVLMLDPEHRDAHRGLTQSLLDQQRLQEVRHLVRGALDLDPTDAAYWALLANVEVALGDTASAIRTVETARRLAACPSTLLMLLGDLYLEAGRAAAATACYEVARHTGGIEPVRLLRAVEGLVMMGEGDRASVLLESVAREVPPDPANDRRVRRLRADIAVLKGDLKQALAQYRELAGDDPLDGNTLLRLGDLLRESGLAGEADLTYERAGRLAGFEADALVRRARLEAEGGRMADAVSLLERAQRIEPRPAIARYLDQLQRLVD